MVRSDLASAGVIFTLDPDTGHRGVVLVTSSFGLGESVVQGRVVPDSSYVHKATLEKFRSLVWRKLGTKEVRLVYDATGHRQVRSEPVPPPDRERFSLSDDDALELARWSVLIEKHYSHLRGELTPMDIEWAKDGVSGELFIVQARPETVHSRRAAPTQRLYELAGHAEPLVTGLAIGDAVASARARIIRDPRQIAELLSGEILVTEITDPEWEPIMKKAAGIVTERGGRTSHAAIVARELGIPAVVGAKEAMTKVPSGTVVTISCAEADVGVVYPGEVAFKVQKIDASKLARPRTKVILAERFAQIFHGFSIGSNDLTQLTLGVDRDSTTVAPLFDERNEAVKWSCAHLLEAAHAVGLQVGICGQAPSDYPDFAAFLVEHGIDSVSLSPDALVRTTLRILEVEAKQADWMITDFKTVSSRRLPDSDAAGRVSRLDRVRE